jgi:hypothetical protein
MWRGIRYFLGSAAVVLLSVSTALAADDSASSNSSTWQAVSAPAPVLTALDSARPAAEPPALQLRPVQLARAPIYTLSSSTLLPAGAPAIGFQTSARRARGGMNRRVQWAIAGAAIGAIVGAIDDDPLGKALIGGVVGFGLSYVVRR